MNKLLYDGVKPRFLSCPPLNFLPLRNSHENARVNHGAHRALPVLSGVRLHARLSSSAPAGMRLCDALPLTLRFSQ
jgi:hypothetical protein